MIVQDASRIFLDRGDANIDAESLSGPQVATMLWRFGYSMEGLRRSCEQIDACTAKAAALTAEVKGVATELKAATQDLRALRKDLVSGRRQLRRARDQLNDILKAPLNGTSGAMAGGDGADGVQVRLASLSKREREVMDRILAGEMNKNICIQLGISQRTVEHHRQSVMRKMGVRTVATLARTVGVLARDGERPATLGGRVAPELA